MGTEPKCPETLIFSKSAYNMIDYILEYNKVQCYERDLLTSVVKGLNEGNIIGELFNLIPKALLNSYT